MGVSQKVFSPKQIPFHSLPTDVRVMILVLDALPGGKGRLVQGLTVLAFVLVLLSVVHVALAIYIFSLLTGNWPVIVGVVEVLCAFMFIFDFWTRAFGVAPLEKQFEEMLQGQVTFFGPQSFSPVVVVAVFPLYAACLYFSAWVTVGRLRASMEFDARRDLFRLCVQSINAWNSTIAFLGESWLQDQDSFTKASMTALETKLHSLIDRLQEHLSQHPISEPMLNLTLEMGGVKYTFELWLRSFREVAQAAHSRE